MSNKPPAFQLYADDFLAGTMEMTAEEVGAYIRLLCQQWNRGSIPSDTERLNRMAGCKVSPVVLSKFDLGEDGNLRNARMERVREELESHRGSKSNAGRTGALARWNGKRNATASVCQCERITTAMPKNGSPSPSPTPNTEIERESPATEPDPAEAPKLTAIPTVEEVIACGSMIGVSEEECRKWHTDRKAEGWADSRGITIGNWRRWLTNHRDKIAQARTVPPNGKSQARNPDSAKWLAIKELEIVEAEIKRLKDHGGVDAFGTFQGSDAERAKLTQLAAKRKELKGKVL